MDVANWIKDWIWKKSDAWLEQHPTVLVFDREEPEKLLGYGTWSAVEARSSAGLGEEHLEIAWFGVHRDYQACEADTGHLCADRVYSTVLADARANTDRGDKMAVTLVCDIANDRGGKFWRRCGFSNLEDLAELPPGGQVNRYQRMLLGPGDDVAD